MHFGEHGIILNDYFGMYDIYDLTGDLIMFMCLCNLGLEQRAIHVQ